MKPKEKIIATNLHEYFYYGECPSPDSSLYPFVLVFRTKDTAYSGKQLLKLQLDVIWIVTDISRFSFFEMDAERFEFIQDWQIYFLANR